MKELVDGIREKKVRAAEDVRLLLEENDRLKRGLVAKPSEVDIFQAFRDTPAYYKELNDMAAENIFTTWLVVSKYLTDNPEAISMGLFPCTWRKKK